MQPFTFDQAIVAGLLFLLGLLIGMFFLAGSKWKGRYRSEHALREEIERDRDRLATEVREHQSLRAAADRAPARPMEHLTERHEETVVERRPVVTREEEVVVERRRVAPDDGPPINVDRRHHRDRDGDGVPNVIDPRDGRRDGFRDRDGDGTPDIVDRRN